MKKNNIAIFMSGLSMGGAERVAVSYANWLVNNTDTNVYIIKLDQEESAYQVDEKIKIINYDIKYSKFRLKNIINRFKFCYSKLRQYKIDVVFAMFYNTQAYVYFTKPKSCKLIGSERANILKVNFIIRFLKRFFAKKCDGFVFQTEDIKKYYPKKLQKNSIVIPNAISNKKIYEVENMPKKNIITSLGRLTEQKGFDTLIRSFKKVNEKHKDYILEIYGQGEDENYLKNLIDELNLTHSVFLRGTTNDSAQKLAQSKIFVLSSRYEGMPNALIEAMAVGTACIATNCPFGPSYLIKDGKNGILVDVDDINAISNKIIYLIENEDKRKKIEKEAIKLREELNVDIIYKKYYDYFCDIIKKKFDRIRFKKIILALSYRGYLKWIDSKTYLKILYRLQIGKKLNLKDPKTFNEKIQWLKLYDKNPNYTKMVDKYLVRDYIKEKIGEEYLIPLIGVYDKFDDIDFDKLPNQFVIKCNHDSGGLIICRDKSKLEIEKARLKINSCMKKNYYYWGREWPYKNVKPRIIIEKYMGDNINDYKFFCFNGVTKLMFIATDRSKHDTKFNFYDLNFKLLPFSQHYPNDSRELKKPINFDKMISLSKELSKNMPHVRVDFYEVDGKVYFGELTFSHFSGIVPFEPEEWDLKIGNMLKLPKGKKYEK